MQSMLARQRSVAVRALSRVMFGAASGRATRFLSSASRSSAGVSRSLGRVASAKRVTALTTASVASKASVFARGFASLPEHVKVAMPALSPTMEKGTIAKWHKKEGDAIKAGDVMADVETDKATVAFEATEPGILAKILVGSGKEVPLGAIVAIVVDDKAAVAAFKDFKLDSASADAAPAAPASAPAAAPAAPAAAAPTPAPAPTPAAPAASSAGAASGDKVVASPLAKKLAAEKGIDLSNVAGTGPGRRIVRADVDEYKPSAAAAKAGAPAVAAAGAAGGFAEFKDIAHTNIRKTIASRLSFAKQTIPHYYLSVDVAMDKLLKARNELNARLASAAPKGTPAADVTKLSVNDFVIKAVALACRKVPEANSAWMDTAVRQYNYVDVSVAVTTDTGLITPIVKDADIKGLAAISRDVKELAGKARAGKLAPAEYQGGTFTVSNLGMFGVKSFSAIINPPQACILAVGATDTRVVPAANAKPGEPAAFTTAQVMSVTLSCDHRVVDGAVGAQWLAAFKSYLEDPQSMLL